MDEFIKNELEGFCDKSPVLKEMFTMPQELNNDIHLKESITETILSSIKKTKSTLLLVISSELYETLVNDKDLLNSYIDQQLAPWHEDTLVEPYIVLKKEEAIEEYLENEEDYPDKNDYYMKNYGGILNENGDVISQINENAEYSSYTIKNYGMKVTDIMEMILSDKLSFTYILHDGHLCNKKNNDSINKLTECDQNSYFVVIECLS